MTTQLDIFVGSETLIDFDVYQLWLDGQSVNGAAKLQQKKGCLLLYGATFEMLLSEVADQFRTFLILEGYLKTPSQLTFQLEFQLTPEVQNMLIERYYKMDSSVTREILGKKLSARLRGSLDEVAEKSNVSVKSCRRQFDNIKRIFKTVEDQAGRVYKNISVQFLLSEELARKYAAIVFLNTSRFDLNKKKLGHVSFAHLVTCSNLVMQHWANNENADGDLNDTDLDRDFLSELKDFKVILDKDNMEEHKEHFIATMKTKICQDVAEEFAITFKILSRTIVNTGINLTNGKELRDLFINLYEKIIEPSCQQQHSNKNNFQLSINAYHTSFYHINCISKSAKCQLLVSTWDRFLDVLKGCLLQLYPQD